MCRSAPPRISTIERLENPDVDQESILPFEIHAGALWTVAENWADLAQIESDPEWSPSVLDDQEDFGLLGPDDDTPFFSNNFEQDEEEEERQLEVYRGLQRPRDDEDWRLIFERFSNQLFDITGVRQEFHEWVDAWLQSDD